MKAATANSFRACIFIGTSFASSWYPWSDLTDPGEALLSSYCRLRSRKMHARCQKAGRRIKDFKFLVGKRMQKFSVDTTQRMPRDHCQHTRTAPTCWRRRACEPALARLLGTRNPEPFHAELKGRTFDSKPDSRALRSAEDPVGVSENR